MLPKYETEWEDLNVLPYSVCDDLFSVFSNPKANGVFERVLGKYFHPLEIQFLKANSYSMSFVKEYLTDKKRMTKEQFDELFVKFNTDFLNA